MGATVGLAIAWLLLLRPIALGGPATFVAVAGTSMEPGLHSGDLVITHTADGYRIGDVVAYRIPEGQALAGAVVIHRITGGDGAAGFLMQGDNNPHPDPWRPRTGDVLGSAWVEIPGNGRLLVLLRSPIVLAALLGAFAAAWFYWSGGVPRARAARPGPANP